jgi:hypothetical protein
MGDRKDDVLARLAVGFVALAFDVVMNRLCGCGPLLTAAPGPRKRDGQPSAWSARRPAQIVGERANGTPTTPATNPPTAPPPEQGPASTCYADPTVDSLTMTPRNPDDGCRPHEPDADVHDTLDAPAVREVAAFPETLPHFRILGTVDFHGHTHWIIGLYEADRCAARLMVQLLDLKCIGERIELWVDGACGPRAIRVDNARDGGGILVRLSGGGSGPLVRFSTLAAALDLQPQEATSEPTTGPGIPSDFRNLDLPPSKDGCRPRLFLARLRPRRRTEATLDVDLAFSVPRPYSEPKVGSSVRVRTSMEAARTLAQYGLMQPRILLADGTQDTAKLSPVTLDDKGQERRTLAARRLDDGRLVPLAELRLVDNPSPGPVRPRHRREP